MKILRVQWFEMVAQLLAVLVLALLVQAQQPGSASSASAEIPKLIRYSAIAKDEAGKPMSGTVGITFALYKDQQGGAALWVETQNVQADSTGHYQVMLGAASSAGLPFDIFAGGEARWLGVQIAGQAEQSRVMLASVPYAMKAGDAATVGGLPASAFVKKSGGGVQQAGIGDSPQSATGKTVKTISPYGSNGYLPMWTGVSTIQNSNLFQNGSGNVGIGTASPGAMLDVNGTGNFRGLVTFAAGQTFPGAGTVTSVASGTGLTGGPITNSGTLSVDPGQVPFLVANNNFTGNQLVSGNLSATGLVTGSGYQIGSNLFAFGSLANGNAFVGFAGNAGMSGNSNVGAGPLALSGNSSGAANTAIGAYALENNSSGLDNTATGFLALQASKTASYNTATGSFALSFNTTGSSNTASGNGALYNNTTGSNNTADGVYALVNNTTGGNNTAMGLYALISNTLGNGNTAVGLQALNSNTGDASGNGSSNTASGVNSLFNNTVGNGNTADGLLSLRYNTTGNYNTGLGYVAITGSGNLTNATAIGALAEVDASNSLVLGSINGVNGATANTNVGIGTTTPASTLDVHGTGNFTGLVTFAPGQTFPGTGTITGVTAGTDLTGGGGSGTVTLNVDTTKVVTGIAAGTDLTGGGTGGVQTLSLDTTKVPQLNTGNTFAGNQTVNGNLSATGLVTGSSYQIGSNLFDYGSYSSKDALLGFAGNGTITGFNNTAIGYQAFNSNGGIQNTATGSQALYSNTGNYNTAIGVGAMYWNTSGSFNTAGGQASLQGNSTGTGNTAEGYAALEYSTGSNNTGVGTYSGNPTNNQASTGSSNTYLGYQTNSGTQLGLSNATAIGANAQVTAGNAMVLGSINGVNSATADTMVGIGITSPSYLLHIGNSGGTPSNGYLRIEGPLNQGSGIPAFSVGGYGDFRIDSVGHFGGRFYIAENGFVGVGMAGFVPTHIFQIGQGLGSAYADGWATYSSRRWKTNIHPLEDALAKVERLRGVSYDLRASGKHEIGVIAEEVGEVLPEVVSYEANGKDAQGVDYSRLTALLIEAVKQQQRQITAQQRYIATQQKQIDALRQRATRLEFSMTQPQEKREQVQLASAK